MSYKIQITAEAEQEIRKAKEWYEEKAYGLGEKFLDEIKQSIDSLSDPILDHKLVFKNYRRILLRRFPYMIYYIRDTEAMRVRIFAVLHNRQSQDTLWSALGEK